jgi:hypothetical protein
MTAARGPPGSPLSCHTIRRAVFNRGTDPQNCGEHRQTHENTVRAAHVMFCHSAPGTGRDWGAGDSCAPLKHQALHVLCPHAFVLEVSIFRGVPLVSAVEEGWVDGLVGGGRGAVCSGRFGRGLIPVVLSPFFIPSSSPSSCRWESSRSWKRERLP